MTAGAEITVAALHDLAGQVAGQVAHRDDPQFAALLTSPFPNPLVPWAAQVVVRARSVPDVRAAVRFASEHGMPIAVRGGGVGSSGSSAESLLIDLRDLNAVDADPDRLRARIEGGAIWQDASRELARHGLAGAAPQFPRLGVAGHVLGGGHGWLSGRLGWAADTVRAVDVVTADGALVRARADENADLFWAMRGAGANFGVAVGIELDVIPLREVSFGIVWFHPDRPGEALETFRDWVTAQPDDVTAIGSLGAPPPGWDGPAHLADRPAVHILVCHCGPAERAESDLADLRSHPAVVADSVRRMPWVELAAGNDVFASGVRRRSRMHYVHDFDDEVVEITRRQAGGLGPLDFMSTHYYGGALQRAPEDASAMSHRDKPWNYMVAMTWTDPAEDAGRTRWQDAYLDEIAARSHDAYYVNYLFAEPDHVRAAYNSRTWEHLVDLKSRWDPQNLFRNNQNIEPARPRTVDRRTRENGT